MDPRLYKCLVITFALLIILFWIEKTGIGTAWRARYLSMSQRDSNINFIIGENLPQNETLNVKLERCNCERQLDIWEPFPPGWRYSEKDSACSPSSYLRGPGQRIISFSYFDPLEAPNLVRGNKFTRRYFEGIEDNLATMKELYPGFIMRLYYHDHPETLERLCELACREPALDLCEVNLVEDKKSSFLEKVTKGGKQLQDLAMLWRFLPLMDETVDLIFSRDLDSLPSAREISAVSEFLSSPQIFHSMRDNPMHGRQILGGTWGAKVGGARKKFKKAMKTMIKRLRQLTSYQRHSEYDQVLLGRYIWPLVKPLALSHDAYSCKRFGGTVKPFPTQRLNETINFVGAVVSKDRPGPPAQLQFIERNVCPAQCRPKEHSDWKYC